MEKAGRDGNFFDTAPEAREIPGTSAYMEFQEDLRCVVAYCSRCP
jgi:hypothetical protein